MSEPSPPKLEPIELPWEYSHYTIPAFVVTVLFFSALDLFLGLFPQTSGNVFINMIPYVIGVLPGWFIWFMTIQLKQGIIPPIAHRFNWSLTDGTLTKNLHRLIVGSLIILVILSLLLLSQLPPEMFIPQFV